MKNRLFVTISILAAVFLFGCDLNMANDPVARAALQPSPSLTVSTDVQTVGTEIPVEFSDGNEIAVEFTDGNEIPVEFSEGNEIPVEFSDGLEIAVEFTDGTEIPVEFVDGTL